MKKVFQTKLKSITKVLTLVIIASLATFTGCKSYDEDITTLTNDVTSIKTQLASLDTYTKAQIDAKIATLTAEVAALKTSAATKAELATLESKVVTIAALNAYKTQVTTDIAAAVAGLATKVSVDAVSTEVVKVNTALSALGVAVDGKILALKSELNTKDAELAAAIGLVQARVATLEGLVAANTTGVAANKALIVDLQAQLTALKAGTYTKAEIDAKLLAIDAQIKKLGTDLKLEFEVLATRQLTGLLFVPAWVNDGFNAVEVGYIVDIPTAPAVSVKAMFTQQDVTFRFNPTTADLSGTTWSFINNSAVFNAPGASAAPGDNNPLSPLFAAPAFTNNNDGSGTFKLKVGTWSEPATGTNYFALQANKVVDGKTSSVVSDYVKVATKAYTAEIRNKVKSTVTAVGVVTPPIATKDNYYSTSSLPDVSLISVYHHEIVKGTQIDLKTLVLATANNSLVEKTFEAANFGTLDVDYKFVFSLPLYPGTDGSTNQNSNIFVTLKDGHILEANATPAPGDRTPLVKVQLKTMSGNLIAEKYIKFKITDKASEAGKTYSLTVPAVTYDYSQLFVDATAGVSAGDYKQIAVSWESVNTSIYNQLGLTHNQFRVKYPSVTSVKATVNGVNDAAATLAKYPLNTSALGPDVDTYAMTYNITPAAKFGTTVLTYTFETGVVTDAKVEITISYTINKPVLDKAIISAYQYGNATTVFTQGIKSGTSYAMELNLGEGFGFGSTALKAMFGVGAGKIDPATQEFIVTDNYATTTVPSVPSYIFSQAAPSQTSIPALLGTSNSTGVKMGMNPANPLNVDKRSYPVNFKTTYPNGEVDNFNYTVIFKNPLTIELESTADFDLFDVRTGAKDEINLSKNYVVKMLGEVVFDKTGVTTKAAEYGLTTATKTYQAINIDPAFNYAFSLVTPIAAWENAGTKLTSPQKVADAVFTYSSTFAIVSRTDVINVNHDPASLAKRK